MTNDQQSFEAVRKNGGRISHRRTRPPDYQQFVQAAAWRVAVAMLLLTAVLLWLGSWALIILTMPGKEFWLYQFGLENRVILGWAFFMGTFAYVVTYVHQSYLFRELLQAPAQTDYHIEPDPSDILEFDSQPIPVNTARNTRIIHRKRQGISIHGTELSPELLDALGRQNSPNRDALGLSGSAYKNIMGAMGKDGYVQRVGRSWEWTERGKRWIASVGFPPSPPAASANNAPRTRDDDDDEQ